MSGLDFCILEALCLKIIGTVGVPAYYGGFESLVDNLLDYTSAVTQNFR